MIFSIRIFFNGKRKFCICFDLRFRWFWVTLMRLADRCLLILTFTIHQYLFPECKSCFSFGSEGEAIIVIFVLFLWEISPIWPFATPWTVAHQDSLSLEFSKQENRSRLPFPSRISVVLKELHQCCLFFFFLLLLSLIFIRV